MSPIDDDDYINGAIRDVNDDTDYIPLEETPGYVDARMEISRTRLTVREMYDECLRKMELNRMLADQRWFEILEEVKNDLAWNKSHKAKQQLKGNPRTIANERSKTDGIFKSRAADYLFCKGRVDTYAKILMLAQNEKIIARLDKLIQRSEPPQVL